MTRDNEVQMILLRRIGLAALRKIIADCELADAKLSEERKILRRFVREARKALKQTLAAKGSTVTYKRRAKP